MTRIGKLDSSKGNTLSELVRNSKKAERSVQDLPSLLANNADKATAAKSTEKAIFATVKKVPKNIKIAGAAAVIGGLAFLVKKGIDLCSESNKVEMAESHPITEEEMKLVKKYAQYVEADEEPVNPDEEVMVGDEAPITKEDSIKYNLKPIEQEEVKTVVNDDNATYTTGPLTAQDIAFIKEREAERAKLEEEYNVTTHVYSDFSDIEAKAEDNENVKPANNVSNDKKVETKPEIKPKEQNTKPQKDNELSGKYYVAQKGDCIWNTIKADLAKHPDDYIAIKEYLTKKYGKEPSKNAIICEATKRTLDLRKSNNLVPGDTIQIPNFNYLR